MNGQEATKRFMKIIDFCYKDSKTQDARAAKSFSKIIEKETNHKYLTMIISMQSFFTAHHTDICTLSLSCIKGIKKKIKYLDQDEIDEKENKVYINISDVYERIESRDLSNKELDVKDVDNESKIDYLEKTIAYLYYFSADEREQKIINRALGDDAIVHVEKKSTNGQPRGFMDNIQGMMRNGGMQGLQGLMKNETLQTLVGQARKSVPNAEAALKDPAGAFKRIIQNQEIRNTVKGAASAFGVDSEQVTNIEKTIDKVADSSAISRLGEMTKKIVPNGDVSQISLQNLDVAELGTLAKETMKEITGQETVADSLKDVTQDGVVESLIQKAKSSLPEELVKKGGEFLENLARRTESKASASEASSSNS